MSRDDFRRELGHVFDEMTGSPTAALPDRVRSSLANVPEQRAPFWIAGMAAALIGVIVVGVLVLAEFNRHQTRLAPVGVPTSSPSASPTPDSTLPAFVCAGGSAQSTTPAPAVAFIDALRTGTHPGFDRLTIEFKNGLPGSFELGMQTGTTFTTSPKGDKVTLLGKNGILVVIRGSDLHTSYSGSTDLKTGYATLVEVRQVEDFEGVVQLALGVSGATCYRAFTMTGPDRLVIDIQS
jgi:hypothetical protein